MAYEDIQDINTNRMIRKPAEKAQAPAVPIMRKKVQRKRKALRSKRRAALDYDEEDEESEDEEESYHLEEDE